MLKYISIFLNSKWSFVLPKKSSILVYNSQSINFANILFSKKSFANDFFEKSIFAKFIDCELYTKIDDFFGSTKDHFELRKILMYLSIFVL